MAFSFMLLSSLLTLSENSLTLFGPSSSPRDDSHLCRFIFLFLCLCFLLFAFCFLLFAFCLLLFAFCFWFLFPFMFSFFNASLIYVLFALSVILFLSLLPLPSLDTSWFQHYLQQFHFSYFSFLCSHQLYILYRLLL